MAGFFSRRANRERNQNQNAQQPERRGLLESFRRGFLSGFNYMNSRLYGRAEMPADQVPDDLREIINRTINHNDNNLPYPDHSEFTPPRAWSLSGLLRRNRYYTPTYHRDPMILDESQRGISSGADSLSYTTYLGNMDDDQYNRYLLQNFDYFLNKYGNEFIKFLSLHAVEEQNIAVTSMEGKIISAFITKAAKMIERGEIAEEGLFLSPVPQLREVAQFFDGKLKNIPAITTDYTPHSNVFALITLTEEEKKSPDGQSLSEQELEQKLQQKKDSLKSELITLLTVPGADADNDRIANLFEKILGTEINGNEGGFGTKRSKLGQSFRTSKSEFALLLQQENAISLLSEPFHALGGGCSKNIDTILDAAVKKFRIRDYLPEIEKICASILIDVYTAAAKEALNTSRFFDPIGNKVADILTYSLIINTAFSPVYFAKAIGDLLQNPETGKFNYQPSYILQCLLPEKNMAAFTGDYETFETLIESDPKMAELASYAILKHAIGDEAFKGAVHYIFNHKANKIFLKEQNREDAAQDRADYSLMKQAVERVLGVENIREAEEYITGCKIKGVIDISDSIFISCNGRNRTGTFVIAEATTTRQRLPSITEQELAQIHQDFNEERPDPVLALFEADMAEQRRIFNELAEQQEGLSFRLADATATPARGAYLTEEERMDAAQDAAGMGRRI